MINIQEEYGMRNRNNYFKLELYTGRASETQSYKQDEKERLGRCSGIASGWKVDSTVETLGNFVFGG